MNPIPSSPIIGEARNQELLEKATTYVYENTPQGDLSAHFFFPPDFDHTMQQRPVIVFFHGGVWDISAPTQFIPHCHHFAARGMIAVTAEYRTKSKYDGGPEEAMADVKTLISFLRFHAAQMGVDPNRIIACGASAGAHAVLCATLHPHEIEGIPSPKPQALILFGPVTDTGPKGVGFHLFSSPKEAKTTSPYAKLPQKELPPCLIFHGTADRVVPIESSVRFSKRYARKKNRCELMTFQNAGHTFFNYNSDEQNFGLTLRAADHFLVDLGYLGPDPLAGEFQ
ncbi:alpha/beta hydrolase [bacterium]|nr:alpha/beta hydrolase [bacterium]MDA7935615.1 alpha/beta hydrolase [Akkermansiaceae bacterium]MDA7537060.1 alpha/beta hydrolase [bacterium]MDB0056304.1 alpha/beta hydrolase [Akkermansiaceae bacterium]MDB0068324.1 alpha/beta hydrolase [Akkermansiaceae bacterium]